MNNPTFENSLASIHNNHNNPINSNNNAMQYNPFFSFLHHQQQ